MDSKTLSGYGESYTNNDDDFFRVFSDGDSKCGQNSSENDFDINNFNTSYLEEHNIDGQITITKINEIKVNDINNITIEETQLNETILQEYNVNEPIKSFWDQESDKFYIIENGQVMEEAFITIEDVLKISENQSFLPFLNSVWFLENTEYTCEFENLLIILTFFIPYIERLIKNFYLTEQSYIITENGEGMEIIIDKSSNLNPVFNNALIKTENKMFNKNFKEMIIICKVISGFLRSIPFFTKYEAFIYLYGLQYFCITLEIEYKDDDLIKFLNLEGMDYWDKLCFLNVN
jgi:hypothetical protein